MFPTLNADYLPMRIQTSRHTPPMLVLLLVLSIFATLSFAQTDTASLFGLVKDSSGGSIANAKVKLLSRSTGAVRQQTTDTRGLYQFEALPSGAYELTVE